MIKKIKDYLKTRAVRDIVLVSLGVYFLLFMGGLIGHFLAGACAALLVESKVGLLKRLTFKPSSDE